MAESERVKTLPHLCQSQVSTFLNLALDAVRSGLYVFVRRSDDLGRSCSLRSVRQLFEKLLTTSENPAGSAPLLRSRRRGLGLRLPPSRLRCGGLSVRSRAGIREHRAACAHLRRHRHCPPRRRRARAAGVGRWRHRHVVGPLPVWHGHGGCGGGAVSGASRLDGRQSAFSVLQLGANSSSVRRSACTIRRLQKDKIIIMILHYTAKHF